MHTLPIKAYTSQEWLALEMEHIFSKTWQFAGFVEELKDTGDFITVQAGLNNLFITKNKQGELKAFHNLCRHRGTQLLRIVGKAEKVITCPYHDWVYNTDGELINIPNKAEEFPHLDKTKHACDLNLIEAAVGIFKGMLFVHPDKNATPISDYFKGLLPFLGPHQVEELVEYSEHEDQPFYTKVIQANWKIVVENYIDHYHLAHLHQNTLNMYDHKKAEFGWVGPHYWFYEPLIKKYEKDVENISPYTLIDSVPREQIGAYVPWFFPNIGIAESEGSWSTFHVTPIAPDQTKVVIRTKVMNVSEQESTAQYIKSSRHPFWNKYGTGAKYQESSYTDDPMTSGDFMKEDIFACEQQQKSLKSPYFSIGATAQRGESAIVKFQSVIKEWIENAINSSK